MVPVGPLNPFAGGGGIRNRAGGVAARTRSAAWRQYSGEVSM